MASSSCHSYVSTPCDVSNHMNPSRKPMDVTATSLMVLLCALWAIQQVVIKAVAHDIPPTLQIALRSGIGMVCIAWVMKRWRISFALHKGPWKAGLVAGGMFAIEFLFIGEGLRYTSASHMVIFLYTAPIFTALGLHWLLPQERLSGLQWLGIGLSFAGIVTAFLGGFLQSTLDPKTILGDTYALLAGLFWGLTTVVLRCTGLNRIHAAQTAQYQLGMAFVGLLLISFLMGQWEGVHWSTVAVSAVVAQGLLIAFLTMLIWFWLLTVYNASQLASFSFLTPIFGVTFGVLILDEPLSINFIAGSIMVILGVAFVNYPRTDGNRPARPSGD